MYTQDSFFTLSAAAQAGLAGLSVALGIGTIALALYFMRGGIVLRLGVAALVFVGFVWLSPQVYYTYYLLLFDIPWQVVVKAPPSLHALSQVMTFRGDASLSAHGQGVLGWLLILAALLRPRIGLARKPTD